MRAGLVRGGLAALASGPDTVPDMAIIAYLFPNGTVCNTRGAAPASRMAGAPSGKA